MAEPWAIEATGLGKSFGETVALRGVGLRVTPGERVTLLGPNGAGKTTLLRLLALLLKPTAGRLRVGGHEPAAIGAPLHRLIGFVGHQSALYPDLTAAENLAFYARLYRVPDPTTRSDALLERLGLRGRRDDRVRTLSRGLQQRLGLARALLHDPPLLLLDEPDSGLDAPGLDLLADLLAAPDRTVVLSTHDLARGQRLGERALVLVTGRVVYDGPAAALDETGLAAAYATDWRPI